MKKRIGLWLALLSMTVFGVVGDSLADIKFGSGSSSGGGGIWGSITGTLGDQSDLQTEVNTKMEEPAGNGIAVRTGNDTSINRSFTSSDGSLTVTNADGVSGNIDAVVDSAVFSRYSSGTGAVPATGSVGTFYFKTDTDDPYTYTSADTETLLLTPANTATLTNKTFDANGTGNSLSNVDVADLANGTDGQIITWDASGNPAAVATGTSGHVLTSNGAGAAPTFQAAAGGGGLDPLTTIRWYTDLGNTCQDDREFDCTTTGTGASFNPGTPEANHYGVMAFDLGTTTSGLNRISTDDQLLLGNGTVTYYASLKTGSTLSDGTDRYTLKAGLTYGAGARRTTASFAIPMT